MFRMFNICKTEQKCKKSEQCEIIIRSIFAAENQILTKHNISSPFES